MQPPEGPQYARSITGLSGPIAYAYAACRQPLSDAQSGRRRTQRVDLDISSHLVFQSGRVLEIRIRNLSAGGLMGEASEWLPVDDSVFVSVPALGDLEVEVVWQMGGKFGACFKQALACGEVFAAGMTGLERGQA